MSRRNVIYIESNEIIFRREFQIKKKLSHQCSFAGLRIAFFGGARELFGPALSLWLSGSVRLMSTCSGANPSIIETARLATRLTDTPALYGVGAFVSRVNHLYTHRLASAALAILVSLSLSLQPFISMCIYGGNRKCVETSRGDYLRPNELTNSREKRRRYNYDVVFFFGQKRQIVIVDIFLQISLLLRGPARYYCWLRLHLIGWNQSGENGAVSASAFFSGNKNRLTRSDAINLQATYQCSRRLSSRPFCIRRKQMRRISF